MIRRIVLTLASSAAVSALAVCLASSFADHSQSSSSRISASDASHAVTHVAVRRSGYIVASS
jgi:hypothetical protein